MSQENVEVVRRYYAAWNQAGVRGVLPFWTPEFEWHDAPEMPDSSVYRGADAVLTLFQSRGRDRAHAGRGHRARLSQQLRGVCSTSVHLDGNASGLPFEGPIFEAIRLRQGKLCQIRLFLSASEALEAAGLRK